MVIAISYTHTKQSVKTNQKGRSGAAPFLTKQAVEDWREEYVWTMAQQYAEPNTGSSQLNPAAKQRIILDSM